MHIPTTKPPLKTYLSRLIHVLKIFICRAVTFPLFVNIRTQRVPPLQSRSGEGEQNWSNYYHAVTCFLANQIKPSTCHNIVITPTPNPTPTAAVNNAFTSEINNGSNNGMDNSSKWTPQLAPRGSKKDYRRKVKYNPLLRLFFFGQYNDFLISILILQCTIVGWTHSSG